MSVKVAGHDGITTVPQVVAAIDWVIDHRNTDGLNIRVLNLSLGQAGVSSHVGDHLSAAVERAWEAGIVVVVAAGNRGETQSHLDSPAIDPYVIAVGALETVLERRGLGYGVPDWSATGDGSRDPDPAAPGRSIASYRVPGSTVDTMVPGARNGDDFFLGTGTSQAAAVTSGVVAAMLQYHPEYTPDMVKATLEYRANEIYPNSEVKDGNGAVNGPASVVSGGPNRMAPQDHPEANGPGSGIVTPTGATWTGGEWTDASWSGSTWSGAVWSGATWSGSTWSGATWSGATWSGSTWSGATGPVRPGLERHGPAPRGQDRAGHEHPLARRPTSSRQKREPDDQRPPAEPVDRKAAAQAASDGDHGHHRDRDARHLRGRTGRRGQERKDHPVEEDARHDHTSGHHHNHHDLGCTGVEDRCGGRADGR